MLFGLSVARDEHEGGDDGRGGGAHSVLESRGGRDPFRFCFPLLLSVLLRCTWLRGPLRRAAVAQPMVISFATRRFARPPWVWCRLAPLMDGDG